MDEANIRRNPWNGLRTYTEGELIYGRNEDTHTLALRILQNTQTIVYGKSGIGKSSILNAGIFPYVRSHGMFPVYVRLEHNVGDSYLSQIKEAIDAEVGRFGGSISVRNLVEERDDETFWEYFHRVEFEDQEGNSVKPLIVFDQFEEIFTLETNRDKIKDFFNQLSDLINNVRPVSAEGGVASHSKEVESHESAGAGKPAEGKKLVLDLSRFKIKASAYKSESDFHIVFTLREDFLSYLERNTVNIPALKNNRFCLQPINEHQAAEIIMMPRPGLVSPEVAKLIIEKVTGENNIDLDDKPKIQVDSAILSLYLSRLYDKMVEVGDTVITSELVETHSDNIIEDFYSDAISGLPENSVKWLEDTLINEDGRRDNRDRSTLLRESELSEDELDRLVNEVKLLRQFSYSGILRVEYIHDVLCPVIVARRQKRNEDERVRLIEQKARVERKKSRRRLFSVVGIFVLLALVAGGIWWWNYYQYDAMVNEYYSDFRLENGWPVGVGKQLSESERAKTPLYYRLSHQGHSSDRHTEVEIMSSNAMLPLTERLTWPEISYIENDVRGQAFNDVLRNVKTLRFEAGDDGSISNMRLVGEDGKDLLVMNYFHTVKAVGENDEIRGEAWIQYLGPDGQSFLIRDNQIDRMKVNWNKDGRISSQTYYSAAGNVLPLDTNNVSGFLWRYKDTDNAHTVTRYYLNSYGLPSQEKAFNILEVTQKGDTTVTRFLKESTAMNSTEAQGVGGIGGFEKIVRVGNHADLYLPGSKMPDATLSETTDPRGNVLSREIKGKTTAEMVPYTTWQYNDSGLETEKKQMTADRRPFGRPEDIYLWQKEYSKLGKVISENRISVNGETQYAYQLSTENKNGATITREEWNDKLNDRYLVKLDTVDNSKGHSAIAFFGRGGVPVNDTVEYGAYNKVPAHWVATDKKDNRVISKYYVYDSDRVVPMPTTVDSVLYRTIAFCREEVMDGGNMVAMQISDVDGNIFTNMLYEVREGQTIGRAPRSIINPEMPVRCPRWEEEQLGYYKIYYSKNFQDEFTALQPFDEFGNESVFMVGDNNYKVVNFLDFNGSRIEGSEALINTQYRRPVMETAQNLSTLTVPFLHILSKESVLYKDGANRLDDGDRIVAVGEWKLGMPEGILAQEWEKLTKDGEKVKIDVLHVSGNKLEPVSVTVTGDSREGARSEYHLFRLTNNEKNRFDKYRKS